VASDDDSTDPVKRTPRGRAGHEHRRWRLPMKKVHVDHVRNDINVTPLVDVMLVLLIIFMLEALVMGRGQQVNRPVAHTVSSEPDKLQPIVSVDEKSVLWVEKTKIGTISECVGFVPDCGPEQQDPKKRECCGTFIKMGEHIQELWKKKPSGDRRVYVNADQEITYGVVAPVIYYLNKDLLLQAIDLAVTEKKE
jgi:biopolymer transport protein ExbD